MRNKNICVSERAFLGAIGGQLFSQAPNRQPRKVENIMMQVREKFRILAYNNNDYYTVVTDDLYKFTDELLKSISEFEELNLSQIEFEKGIKVHDESRGKFVFTDRYTTIPWKRDFIDLDAFIQNVVHKICVIQDVETDCFCCIHAKTDKCKTCHVNPDYKNNYECSREPKGKYTFACKFDCWKSQYICCEECDDKCEKVCNGSSRTCGNALFVKDKTSEEGL